MDLSAAATSAVDPEPDDRHLPLHNLSNLHSRLSTIRHILSTSLTTNTVISTAQMSTISSEITAAITGAIVNATALISATTNSTQSDLSLTNSTTFTDLGFHNVDLGFQFPKTEAIEQQIEQQTEQQIEQQTEQDDHLDIVELDAVELLAEHLHFCEFCGKGFKRDANLRMHMRAHGNRFKTLEALSKPEKSVIDSSESNGAKTRRFSCPFSGCSRNKLHKKFRPLKSVICVKNHFKRSHCPKMYSCNRCHKKNFSVLADLKSHLKHCGETKWKCSCGTSFSRKDKLFGHIALFEGHMPAMPVAADVAVEDGGKAKAVMPPPPQQPPTIVDNVDWVDNGMTFDGLGSIIDDDFCLQDILGPGSMEWKL
ncbi:putative transcription factor C2H2 family [Helianthus anomalus]